MKSLQAGIVRQVACGGGYRLLELDAPEIALSARPGQFAMIRVTGAYDPLLRRPLSIHDVEHGRIRFLYRVVGKGTEMLSRRRPGERVGVLGPLGRGFQLPQAMETAVVIGGGRGVAPLLFLCRWIRRARPGARVCLLYGAATAGEVVQVEVFERLGVEVHLATEDGSGGIPGRVTDLLERFAFDVSSTAWFACGPMPMLEAVASRLPVAQGKLQVSLEAHMGCGIGACRGCVVAAPRGYVHVCGEGPVVWWDRFLGER